MSYLLRGDEMKKQWIIEKQNGEFEGPYNMKQIKKKIRSGEILASMKVLQVNSNKQKLSDIRDIAKMTHSSEKKTELESTLILDQNDKTAILPPTIESNDSSIIESLDIQTPSPSKFESSYTFSKKHTHEDIKFIKNITQSNAKEELSRAKRYFVLIDSQDSISAELSADEIWFLYDREIIDKKVTVGLLNSKGRIPLELFLKTYKEGVISSNKHNMSKNTEITKQGSRHDSSFGLYLIFSLIFAATIVFMIRNENFELLNKVKARLATYEKNLSMTYKKQSENIKPHSQTPVTHSKNQTVKTSTNTEQFDPFITNFENSVMQVSKLKAFSGISVLVGPLEYSPKDLRNCLIVCKILMWDKSNMSLTVVFYKEPFVNSLIGKSEGVYIHGIVGNEESLFYLSHVY